MKVTMTAEYALVLCEVLARRNPDELVSLSKVAKSRRLNYDFLRKVAHLLEDGGILTAEEGRDGGYRLAVKPEQCTVAEVLEAVDEPLVEPDCCNRKRPLRICPKRAICPKLSVLHKIQEATAVTYGKMTLDKIAQGGISCSALWE